MIGKLDDVYVSNYNKDEHKYVVLNNLKVNTESYEYKTISDDNIKNIIKFIEPKDIQNDNTKAVNKLEYCVDDKTSLEEYLEKHRLNKDDLKLIVRSLDKTIDEIENHLLSSNSIIYDLQGIFIDKREDDKIENINFITAPDFESDALFEISKMLILLLRKVDIEDKDAFSFAYGLFVRSSKDNFTTKDLIEICDRDDKEEKKKQESFLSNADTDILRKVKEAEQRAEQDTEGEGVKM